ncbi:MAG: hypothetical protein PHQ40_04500 [Anaerolineaceae bacterium]|nr:hypothetical protein [Anaerolineaceae bacterium]
MRKKVTCRWCGQQQARSKRIVLNRDGTKNFSNPWVYTCFFMGIGITVVTRVAQEWQGLVASLFVVAGALAVAWLIVWRSRLPPGVEFRCSDCGFRWYEDAPVENMDVPADKGN